MQKIGGFKLAVEKRRNYYFEVSALVISFLLLVLIAYSVVFATRVINLVFNNKEVVSAPNTFFDLDKANSIEKIKNSSTNDFPQTIVTPNPESSAVPEFSPII